MEVIREIKIWNVLKQNIGVMIFSVDEIFLA